LKELKTNRILPAVKQAGPELLAEDGAGRGFAGAASEEASADDLMIRRRTSGVNGLLAVENAMYTQRRQGSRTDGGSWDDAMRILVWRRGRVLPGCDPGVWRSDACGSLIRFGDYGKMGDYGWEIDHICPVSRRGCDWLDNLQPLQWRNNRSKGDNWPYWRCAV